MISRRAFVGTLIFALPAAVVVLLVLGARLLAEAQQLQVASIGVIQRGSLATPSSA